MVARRKPKRKIKKKGGCKCDGKGKKRIRRRGGSFIDTLLTKIPELHLWTPWTGKHSFTGPGTRLDRRLDANNVPHAWSKPVNKVDKSALRHDLCYGNYTTTKDRNNICDAEMLRDLREIVNDPSSKWGVKADAQIVRAFIGTKKMLGIGRKRRKRRVKRY